MTFLSKIKIKKNDISAQFLKSIFWYLFMNSHNLILYLYFLNFTNPSGPWKILNFYNSLIHPSPEHTSANTSITFVTLVIHFSQFPLEFHVSRIQRFRTTRRIHPLPQSCIQAFGIRDINTKILPLSSDLFALVSLGKLKTCSLRSFPTFCVRNVWATPKCSPQTVFVVLQQTSILGHV